MNINTMPRFRGIAIEVEGGWSWEAETTILGNNDEGFFFSSKEVFPTKEAAITDLRAAIKSACDEIQLKVIGKATGEYIDMKTNETLHWDITKQN